MGGAFQLLDLLAVTLAILVASLLVAFLVDKLFQRKRTRKRILWGPSYSTFWQSLHISGSLHSF